MTRRRALLAASGAALLAGCAGLAGPGADAMPTRDPALWPFSPDSPWNTALGDGARFAPIRSPHMDPTQGAGINTRQWSHPVHIASADDPTVSIYRHGERTPVRVQRVPVDARPDPMSDGALHLIDAARRHVVELWQAERVGPDRIVAAAVVVNNLTDAGVYPGWHGARAYGGSALAGLIRTGELERGRLPHVLAVAVRPQAPKSCSACASAVSGPGCRSSVRRSTEGGSASRLPMWRLPSVP